MLLLRTVFFSCFHWQTFIWNSVFWLYEKKVLQLMSAEASLERFGKSILFSYGEGRAFTVLRMNGLQKLNSLKVRKNRMKYGKYLLGSKIDYPLDFFIWVFKTLRPLRNVLLFMFCVRHSTLSFDGKLCWSRQGGGDRKFNVRLCTFYMKWTTPLSFVTGWHRE